MCPPAARCCPSAALFGGYGDVVSPLYLFAGALYFCPVEPSAAKRTSTATATTSSSSGAPCPGAPTAAAASYGARAPPRSRGSRGTSYTMITDRGCTRHYHGDKVVADLGVPGGPARRVLQLRRAASVHEAVQASRCIRVVSAALSGNLGGYMLDGFLIRRP